MLLRAQQSCIRPPGFHPSVAAGRWNGPNQGRELLFVFHEQDSLRADGHPDLSLRDLNNVGDLLHSRQVNFKCRAFCRRALDPNITAALLDDSIDHCKTQPRTLTPLLCRKKGLEDVALDLLIHYLAA